MRLRRYNNYFNSSSFCMRMIFSWKPFGVPRHYVAIDYYG